ncbi:MAG: hypothetical protein GVY14_11970 [Spirochaetes bacterium]|nr:hypothetical protein [Spirochaetota bacterium]
MLDAFQSTKQTSGGHFTAMGLGRVLWELIFLFLMPVVTYAQACEPPRGLKETWGLRAHDLEALADQPGEPRLVEKNIRTLNNSEQGELEARLHMHALFGENIAHFKSAIRDIERQENFLPRLEASEVLCSSGRPVTYARVRQKLEFRFLIFSREYEYILHYSLEGPAGSGAELNVWWTLAEPIDDQITATDGSWYFEPVVVDGVSYTYMAYGTHTVFREERMGLRAALDRFSERNAAAAMRALQAEAAERAD